jgi:hypothetical protein
MQKKSTPRRTIGNNPLDAVIPDLRQQSSADENTPPTTPAPVKETKERLTIHLPTPLIERVKNAVFWTPGLTLADLGARALEEYITQIEAENGGPFETRRHELKGGRPMR